MEFYLIFIIVGFISLTIAAYFVGKKAGNREQNEKNRKLLSDYYVEKTNAENAVKQLETQRLQYEQLRAEEAAKNEKQVQQLNDAFQKQLQDVKKNNDEQLKALRELNDSQIKAQIQLIEEKMRTTSENVLKTRQEELEKINNEQVTKLLDPFKQSFQDMKIAFHQSKEQQAEALTRLDERIKENMSKSASLGESADRLTHALTGEVKVQGNFGEMRLQQLLENLQLKEGEQFETQFTLRSVDGKPLKGDDGKGLIPDVILHFPNNRHIVVDSKMSFTAFYNYMNAEDGSIEKTAALQEHIRSMRSQVAILAKKEYTKYLPVGYNKLDFAVMYVPIEGALNLALLNDTSLWNDAYNQGVVITGSQNMYMMLRILEMTWMQVRQYENQEAMMLAANRMIERVQEFGRRFMDVEKSMSDTFDKMKSLKVTIGDRGQSIVTAANALIEAGAKESQLKVKGKEKPTIAQIEQYSSAN